MVLYAVGWIIIIVSFTVVGWLMYSEKKSTDEFTQPLQKTDHETADKVLDRLGIESQTDDFAEPETFTDKIFNLLDKIGLGRFIGSEEDEPEIRPHLPEAPSLKPVNQPKKEIAPVHTQPATSPREEDHTPPAEAPSQKEHTHPTLKSDHVKIENYQLSREYTELKEKYKNLEKLFDEKSEELQRTHETLANEIKNRKDFNKVKDILEKELKDIKIDKRKIQMEYNAIQAESDSQQKRINQLEEKTTKLEKELLAAEDAVKDKHNEIITLKNAVKADGEVPPQNQTTNMSADTQKDRTDSPSDEDATPADIPEPPQEEEREEPETDAQPDTAQESSEPRELDLPADPVTPSVEIEPSTDINLAVENTGIGETISQEPEASPSDKETADNQEPDSNNKEKEDEGQEDSAPGLLPATELTHPNEKIIDKPENISKDQNPNQDPLNKLLNEIEKDHDEIPPDKESNVDAEEFTIDLSKEKVDKERVEIETMKQFEEPDDMEGSLSEDGPEGEPPDLDLSKSPSKDPEHEDSTQATNIEDEFLAQKHKELDHGKPTDKPSLPPDIFDEPDEDSKEDSEPQQETESSENKDDDAQKRDTDQPQ